MNDKEKKAWLDAVIDVIMESLHECHGVEDMQRLVNAKMRERGLIDLDISEKEQELLR